MFYSIDETIPPNTLADDPVRIDFPVSHGVLRFIDIRWRWGSADLCGSRLLYHEDMVCPLSRVEWIPSFQTPVQFDEFYSIDTPPYHLTLEAYNTDESWSHTIWVGVIVMTEESLYYEAMVMGDILRRVYYGTP